MYDYTLLNQRLQEDLRNSIGYLTSDNSIETANRFQLSTSWMKKFTQGDDSEANARCLALFKKSNGACASFRLQPKSIFEEMVIGEVKSLFDSFFSSGPDLDMDLARIAQGFMPGPGASLSVSSYNFYTKLFDCQMSCTSDLLYRLFRSSLSSYPTWLNAEKARFLKFGNIGVAGNRLSFVPKTSEISRSICTEPNLNMLFQKGIGAYLETILKKRFNISLDVQPDLNRKMAQTGSIDGSFGTIDLSSASDSMSLNLMKELIPLHAFKWFNLARSPSVTFPDGTQEELHMISSMGNAFTFPLQTLLFASIVVSCYKILGLKTYRPGSKLQNWAVFGDDIIVVKDAYSFVIRCLQLFGFTVNDLKSFNSGDFRESCGCDYFRGHDVRGVYLKSLRGPADVYSAINRLVRWSSRTGILLPNAISTLKSFLRGKILRIPFTDGDAEGLKVPFPPDYLTRRDARTGALYYYALVTVPRGVRLPSEPDQDLYYPFKNGKKTKIFFNPDGLIVSLVAGVLRNGRIGIRALNPNSERSKVRRRSTSSWGGSITPPDASLWISHLNRIDSGFVSSKTNISSLAAAGLLKPDQGSEWEITAGMYDL